MDFLNESRMIFKLFFYSIDRGITIARASLSNTIIVYGVAHHK